MEISKNRHAKLDLAYFYKQEIAGQARNDKSEFLEMP